MSFSKVKEVDIKLHEGEPGAGYGRIKVHDCRESEKTYDGHITHIEISDSTFATVRVKLDTGFDLTFHLPIMSVEKPSIKPNETRPQEVE